jgi:transposase
MFKEGAQPSAVRQELNISRTTATRWRQRALASKPGRKPDKPKTKSSTMYLADQLAIIAKMIRAKLPELAKFSLTTTADGKASVEYAVRQMSEISGSVKL